MKGPEIPSENLGRKHARGPGARLPGNVEDQLRRIDRALEVNARCKEALRWTPAGADERALLGDVCGIIVAEGGYLMSWIGFIENDPGKTIRPVAYAGLEAGYLKIHPFTWADDVYGRGPSGTAVRTGMPYIARDILTENGFLPWRKEARSRGYASVVAIPMAVKEEIIGVLNIYSQNPDDFDEREIELITELGRDIAFGLVMRRADNERQRLMKSYNDESLRLRAVLEAMPVGVFIADASGAIVMSNDQVEKIWRGKPPQVAKIEDYIQYRGWWADTGKPVMPEEWGLARAIRKGETTKGDVVDIQRFDGTRGTVFNSSAPIEDSEGRVIGAVVVSQDITHIRRLEKDLTEAKEKSDLYVDLMAHDINNMNQVGMGFLEIALLEMDENKALTDRKLLEKPLEALANSSELIDKVRKLQKARAGRLDTGPVDLCGILSGLAARYSGRHDRRIDIKFIHGNECHVKANGLVEEIFSNLVGNAVKHSDPDKPLSVLIEMDTERRKGVDYVRVTVEDNGPGIQDDLKAKLFTRFQRGNTKAHGIGLGLYLVRTLVEGFRGKVRVEDRVAGDSAKGARFVVLLPENKSPGSS